MESVPGIVFSAIVEPVSRLVDRVDSAQERRPGPEDGFEGSYPVLDGGLVLDGRRVSRSVGKSSHDGGWCQERNGCRSSLYAHAMEAIKT